MTAESRRAQRFHERQAAHRRRAVLLIGVPVVLVLVIGVVVSASTRPDGDDEPEFVGTTLQVELGDYFIEGDLTAPAGPVKLEAVNVGNDRHNIGIRRGRISREVQSGESVSVEIGDLVPGEYELYCDLVGHVEAGMVATLVVT